MVYIISNLRRKNIVKKRCNRYYASIDILVKLCFVYFSDMILISPPQPLSLTVQRAESGDVLGFPFKTRCLSDEVVGA